MQKDKTKRELILKRVSLANWAVKSWDNEFVLLPKGRTGTIVSTFRDGSLSVRFDGNDAQFSFQEDDLYFPDSPLGYNQKCFNQ